MTMLELDQVSKGFRSGPETLTVLEEISLEIPENNVTVITGESGSGKSTLLNLIGGLDLPSSGEIRSCGYDVSRLAEEDLTAYRSGVVGFVFQFHFLLKDFTVLENTALPGWMAGMPRRKAEARARELLAEVGLAERLSHYPSQLSGGERQRGALARALINSPRLILADEPTGNLDADNSRKVEELLFNLVRRHERNLILVTHDRHLSGRGDSHYHLEKGKLVVQ